jgi:peptidyl-tRNA hydrolase, PTH1 family
LVVGLGNPGRKYENTPHNVGYSVVEKVASRAGLKWRQARKIDAEFAEGFVEGADCLLLKPTTFMNLSGEAVAPLVRGEKIRIESDLLVVLDDVALPLGQLRLRASGSSGGHRGLESLVHHLRGQGFPRLRCGVGPQDAEAAAQRGDLAGYVLARWPRAARGQVEEMTDRAADITVRWLLEPIGDVMTACNRKVLSDEC